MSNTNEIIAAFPIVPVTAVEVMVKVSAQPRTWQSYMWNTLSQLMRFLLSVLAKLSHRSCMCERQNHISADLYIVLTIQTTQLCTHNRAKILYGLNLGPPMWYRAMPQRIEAMVSLRSYH